jgi:hypothetical protein
VTTLIRHSPDKPLSLSLLATTEVHDGQSTTTKPVMPNILLFREPSPDSTDRYEDLFHAHPGYTAKSIPVLETVHTNIDLLSTHLKDQFTELSGVVITSKRSCDALNESLQRICEERDISGALGR